MSNKFKRKKIATIVEGIEIYTANVTKRAKLKQQLIKMNGEAVKMSGEEMLLLVEQGIELTDSMMYSIRINSILKVAKEYEGTQREWFKDFTNIDMRDVPEDVLSDPSEKLRAIFNAINRYVVKPVRKEVRNEFDDEMKIKGEETIRDMELGE